VFNTQRNTLFKGRKKMSKKNRKRIVAEKKLSIGPPTKLFGGVEKKLSIGPPTKLVERRGI